MYVRLTKKTAHVGPPLANAANHADDDFLVSSKHTLTNGLADSARPVPNAVMVVSLTKSLQVIPMASPPTAGSSAGISDFNFVFVQKRMPATLWCQARIILATVSWQMRFVGQFGWLA